MMMMSIVYGMELDVCCGSIVTLQCALVCSVRVVPHLDDDDDEKSVFDDRQTFYLQHTHYTHTAHRLILHPI